jgi:1,4-dihydroxy-2-naphthoyl-CoA hydrolase
MAFLYQRTVRFQDTDAAGVVYFANTLAMCHEAYEASLIAAGIEVRQFFRASGDSEVKAIAFPIVHAEADYLRPAFCGDRHEIQLTPTLQSDHAFEIQYVIYEVDHPEQPISKALTRHVCIDPISRQRQPLPQALLDWLNKWKQSST